MITLQVNKFLGTITNLIAYVETANTAEEGEVGAFVASFQSNNVEKGNGKVIRAADYLNVEEYNEESSLLTPRKPKVDEQYITVENFKVIPVTINEYLMRGAFVEEDQMANFIGFIRTLMEKTRTAYLSDGIIALLEEYIPTQESQKVEVHVIDTDTLKDPMQLEAANRYNGNAMQKAFIKLLQSMGWPTTKYNDLGFKETIDNGSLKLLIKQNESLGILVDTLAYLLNSNKITDAQKWSRTFAIPDDQFKGSTEFFAWLMHNNKIQFGYYYSVQTSFFDASTLNQTDWLHFSYYLDIVKALPAVVFKLLKDIKPAALAAE